MPHPKFAAWDFSDLASKLADALDARRALAEPLFLAIHEEAKQKFRGLVDTYEGRSRPIFEVFPSWESYLVELRDQSPAAFELGMDFLSKTAPAACLPIALGVTELSPEPWEELWDITARALARADDERAFEALVRQSDRHAFANVLGYSAWSRAEPKMLELYGQSDDFSVAAMRWFAEHGSEQGWPLVARHHEQHHDLDSAHALMAYGDERSLAILEAGLRSGAPHRINYAVRAYLKRPNVIERMGGLAWLCEPEQESVAEKLIYELARSLKEEELERTPEYADLARHWAKAKCKDKRTRDVAKWLLMFYAPPKPARPATPKRAVRDASPAMLELMTRARGNLERIVQELKKQKYRFERPRAVLAKPTAKSKRSLLRLERELGPLPHSLRAAYEVIVACDLRGTHPTFEKDWYTDPFALLPVESVLEDAEDAEGEHSVVISGDAIAKAGFSGGTYTIDVPNDADDANLAGAAAEETFVQYLQRSFEWGGFPGFSNIDAPLPVLVQKLRDVCEPI
jgi:hypothetical protein